jgi:uncharacterized protein
MSEASSLASSIYIGDIRHTRLRPSRHRLRYRMLTFLVDLDELPALAARVSVFSFNRFNLFSFHERDHLSGTKQPLRLQVEEHLHQAGIHLDGGAIKLLCMPSVLGCVFNPISIYFCHGPDRGLRAILYEVNNTFGERHSYLIQTSDPFARIHLQQCDKAFFVSPFMDMNMHYRFHAQCPGSKVLVGVRAYGADGLILSAVLTGHRHELSTGGLLKAFVRQPLLALQVFAAIHWEALKLWRKGLRPRTRPPAPHDPVTIVHSRRTA